MTRRFASLLTGFAASCMAALCLAAGARAQDTDDLLAKPDPVVEAIASAPRDEPADYARAVFVLAELGQAERAKPVLAELIAQQPDDAALAALVEGFGSAKFLRLARDPAMGPEAAEFAGRCLAAAAAVSRSPERLAAIINRLDTDDDRQRRSALVDLKTTGVSGAQQLLGALAEAENQTRQNRLRKALVALAPASTPLLLAALESGEGRLAPQAAVALAEVGDPRAVAPLAVAATLGGEGPLPETAAWALGQITGTPFDFRRFEALTSRGVENLLAGGPATAPDAEGRVAIARWDSEAKRPVVVRLPSSEAAVVLAAPIARAQAAVLGDRPALVQRGLLLELESRAILRRAGVAADAAPLPTAGLPPHQLSGALKAALGEGRHGAAAALCGALADLGDTGVLATADARPAPLAAAVDAPHPAVRFAALEALFRLRPTTPFPGSSRVLPTLRHCAAGEGRDALVVAMPNLDRAANLAGRLSGLEGSRFRTAPTNRGREAVELAGRGADVVAVMVDMAILDPPVRETLFRLRRQASSAGLPIALTAGAGRLADAEQIAKQHTGVIATPRPHTDQAVATILEQLDRLRPDGWPDRDARAAQAEQARRWIAGLRISGPAFYGLPAGRAAERPGGGARPLPPAPR